MCYSATDSINAFLISSLGCFLLLMKHNKEATRLAYIFFYASLMQIYDYVFWTNNTKNGVNHVFTKIAMITNYLQPIVAYYILKDKLADKPYITYISGIYALCAIIFMYVNWDNIDYTISSVVTNHNLNWLWYKQKYTYYFSVVYYIALFAIFFNGFDNKLITFLVIVPLVFLFMKKDIYNPVGRFWCYFVNFIPIIIALIINYQEYIVAIRK